MARQCLCNPQAWGVSKSRALDPWKVGGEGCAMTRGAFNDETAPVAVHHVLDDGKPQARAEPLSTFLSFDPIESLG